MRSPRLLICGALFLVLCVLLFTETNGRWGWVYGIVFCLTYVLTCAIYLLLSFLTRRWFSSELTLHASSLVAAFLLVVGGPILFGAIETHFEERARARVSAEEERSKHERDRVLEAARAGSLPLVQQALAAGADPEAPCTFDEPCNEDRALHVAIQRDDLQVAKALLEHGAKVNVLSGYGDPPLVMAMKTGDLPMFRLLLDHGADPALRNRWRANTVIEAMYSKDPQFLTELMSRHLPSSVLNNPEAPPLGAAAHQGDLRALQLFLDGGADPNLQDSSHQTALCAAAQQGEPQAVRFLVEHGAGLNTLCEGGQTALMEASFNGNVDVVEVLLEHGAARGLKTPEGLTALELARSNHQQEVVDVFRRRRGR